MEANQFDMSMCSAIWRSARLCAGLGACLIALFLHLNYILCLIYSVSVVAPYGTHTVDVLRIDYRMDIFVAVCHVQDGAVSRHVQCSGDVSPLQHHRVLHQERHRLPPRDTVQGCQGV